MSKLRQQLEELAKLPPAQVRNQWQHLFRCQVPDHSPHLLRRQIAWKLQSRVEGDVSPTLRKKLSKLSKDGSGELNGRLQASEKLQVGTKLVREWNGRTIEVLVTDAGYEHAGRHYRSLSQIARQITGAHWSGPRFFGLVKRSAYKKAARS